MKALLDFLPGRTFAALSALLVFLAFAGPARRCGASESLPAAVRPGSAAPAPRAERWAASVATPEQAAAHRHMLAQMAGAAGAGVLSVALAAGFGMLAAAGRRRERAAVVALNTFAGYVGACLGFCVLGFGVMCGGLSEPALNHFALRAASGGLLGGAGFFLRGTDGAGLLLLNELLYLAVAVCVIVQTVGTRLRFGVFLLYALAFGAFLYPVYGCWAWGGGWLAGLGAAWGWGRGYADWAGGSVAHAMPAFSALALLVCTRGRHAEERYERPKLRVGGTLLTVAAGCLLAPPGAEGFGAAAIPILAAAGAGALVGALAAPAWRSRGERACHGALGAMVSAMAVAGFAGALPVALVGAAGAALGIGLARGLERRAGCGAVALPLALHGACGLFGAMAVGMVADGRHGVTGLLHGRPGQLICQLVGALACVVWSFAATYLPAQIGLALQGRRVARAGTAAGARDSVL